MSLHVTQGYASITVETGVDVAATGATVTKILYRKPSGKRGSWAASVVDTTKLRYELKNTDLDEAGTWTVQSFFSVGNRHAFGNAATFDVQTIV